MNKISTIFIGETKHNVFLQAGLYNFTAPSLQMHKHYYTEVHMVYGENTILSLDDKVYDSSCANVYFIPCETYHAVKIGDQAKHTAFQLDYTITSPACFKADKALIAAFFNKIEETQATQNYADILAYIQLFCNLYLRSKTAVEDIVDYKFLIHDFFAVRYGESVRLGDLAKVLSLSERQTERLVQMHTGNSFREELTSTRLRIANRLLETTDMSLTEIAHYVGFESYNGFWKAMKKHPMKME